MKKELATKFNLKDLKVNNLDILKQIMSFYPNKQLYKIKSAKSKQEIISVYPSNTKCKVYKHEEWHSDDYEITTQEIDFTVSFFKQFQDLLYKTPVVALLSNLQQNSEYCHDVEGMKNCYYCFDGLESQDSYYCYRIHYCKSCVDCYSIYHSELLYECVNLENSYNSKYSYHCKQVSDSHFLINCRNIQNSFMCSNLRNKKYCIYNKQYTKEEYEQFILKIDFCDYKQILYLKKYFYEKLLLETFFPPAFVENCENVSGNYLKNSFSVENVFESWDMKDAYNCFQCSKGKDVMHSFMCCEKVEKCFQCVAVGIESYETINCAFVWHSSFMEYCYMCLNCNYCFGCIGLRNKKYCILNKQYSKKEYFEKKEQLINKMKKEQTYGLFFPISISPFHYEDTIAYDLFDAKYKNIFNEEFKKYSKNYIQKTDSICTCQITKKDFLITQQEKNFYNKNNIPFPRISFQMRHKNRMELMSTNFYEKSYQSINSFFKNFHKRKIVSKQLYEKIF
jgi:hypothetical protein